MRISLEGKWETVLTSLKKGLVQLEANQMANEGNAVGEMHKQTPYMNLEQQSYWYQIMA